MLRSEKILFMVTGSIAAYKAAQVVSRLVQNGNEVQVVASSSALKFIGAATFEGLTGKAVLTDLWENGRAMDHIHLSRWADLGVICPASANTMSRMANGMADDLISSICLAWPKEKTLHIFPAMNSEMLSHPATIANMQKLADYGFVVHATQEGSLACGEQGAGRLLEPEDILRRLSGPPSPKPSVLITAGATREPIDGIRFISNVSTGRTSAGIADHFTKCGWLVTYVHGAGAVLPKSKVKRLSFGSFSDLDETLRKELASHSYSAIIHAAAVSDYSVASVNGESAEVSHKLHSEKELSIQLKANFKILPRLKEYSSNKSIYVIGFKLTLNQNSEHTDSLARGLLSADVDSVVANDWSLIDKDQHPGRVITKEGFHPFSDVTEMAGILEKTISSEGGNHGPLP